MKKKVLNIGIIISLVTMLFVLTGCGSANSEAIQRVKEKSYGEETLESVLKKGLKNISYEEEKSESGVYTDVTITGTNKKSGDKVEILYRVRDNSIGIQTYKVNGESEGVIAYDNFLSSLTD